MNNNVVPSRFLSFPGKIPSPLEVREGVEQTMVVVNATDKKISLPPEILYLIFEFIPKNPALLFNFLKINHAFYNIIRSILLKDPDPQKKWFREGCLVNYENFKKENIVGELLNKKIEGALKNITHVSLNFILNDDKDVQYSLNQLYALAKKKDIKTLHVNFYFNDERIDKSIIEERGNDVTNKLVAILHNNSSLQEIGLRFKGKIFSCENIINILKRLEGRNVKIHFFDKGFRIKGLSEIAPYLKKINITEFCLAEVLTGSPVFQLLKEVLSSVRKLTLQFGVIDKNDIKNLAGIINKNTLTLDLSGFLGFNRYYHTYAMIEGVDQRAGISNEGIGNLISVLMEENAKNIKEINLSNNEIGDESIANLLTLMSIKNINKVNLSGNRISINGVEGIIRGLPKNDIEYLNFSNLRTSYSAGGEPLLYKHIEGIFENTPNIKLIDFDKFLGHGDLSDFIYCDATYQRKNGKIINIVAVDEIIKKS